MNDDTETHNRRLELWGGVECTVNRVHDKYFEQLNRNGHDTRISDLDLFADLGITALRQPVIWELVAPNGLSSANWEWTDQWLVALRERKIRPIVGLVHHGSGPRHTSLLDPAFPQKLAEYARAVAQRYPWVYDYTPVNEPLTTARFSGLYGHWYPHGRDHKQFLTALLFQCRAIVMAMRAIREVNPQARLVQTDDLGKIFSSPLLRYQAEFENERRWLAWDLLRGSVNPQHRLWQYIVDALGGESKLRWFLENPCPPDIIGINHYLSSDRYLDERTERYPGNTHGGNGIHRYADVLAARVRDEGAAGAHLLICEAWERYRIPIVLTEVHNGCTREEQIRWFLQVWREAEQARRDGVDVRALTAWSLLGAFDWNSLVTQENNHYEPGVFDARSTPPRPTAIAHLAGKLAHGENSGHHLLDTKGWWARPQRFIYGHSINDSGSVRSRKPHGTSLHLIDREVDAPRPVLITGGRGTLGRALERACVIRGIAHRLLVRSEMDISNAESVQRVFNELRPWAVINAAGYVRVDDAESDFKRCYRENTKGAKVLAAACVRSGAKFVTFSSDLVFDGGKDSPYVESDAARPLNCYGASKMLAEQGVGSIDLRALIVRTSAFFGPWDEHNFVTIALRTIATGKPFFAADDAVVSPTYVPDLVDATLDLTIDDESGIWHLANEGEITWADLARDAAQGAGLDASLVHGRPTSEFNLPAHRPLYSAMRSERGQLMPSLATGLGRYFAECTVSLQEDLERAA